MLLLSQRDPLPGQPDPTLRKTNGALAVTCPSCSHEFTVRQYAKKRPRRTALCEECGKPFTQWAATRKRFCSRSCWVTYSHKRRTPVASGYVRLFAGRGYPGADSRGRILEHRKVMQDILGRPLQSGELVHHRNGIRNDNRPENLELVSAIKNNAYSYVDGRRAS